VSVRVGVDRAALDPGAAPPTFGVRTDRAFCEIQLATDPVLFTSALAARRRAENFAVFHPALSGGRAQITVDRATWRELARSALVYYRALAYSGSHTKRTRVEETTPEADYTRAPAVLLATAGRQPVPLRGRLSGVLPWLRVERNRVVNEAGDVVVLRGIVRSGMESTERNGLDPQGVRRLTTREVAGIEQGEIREIVRRWRANVIRLPLNQEWILTRVDYIANLDRIVEWAAAEGAYTLLSIEWLDARRAFGTRGGVPNRLPPLPEENTVRALRVLAQRYRNESAVLYQLLGAPHEALPNDTEFLLQRPVNEAGWLALWHSWVRRLETAIHRDHGRAILFVPGWNWGLTLRSYPVPLAAGRSVPGTVYTARVQRADASSAPEFESNFGFRRLREIQPVYVSEWSGDDAALAWGNILEGYGRVRHRFTNGAWQGLAGWTAASWGGDPSLVERGAGSRTSGGVTVRWRTFLRDAAGNAQPTVFGELVRGALGAAPFATTADFDAARPRGQRSRYRIRASAARRGDLFLVWGHDFVPGTRLDFRSGATVATVLPRVVGDFLLLVPSLPAAVPSGAGTCEVMRPDGVRSEPAAVNVVTGAPPQTTVTALLDGAAKASPYTIAFLANAWIETSGGALDADRILTDRTKFYEAVGDSLQSLFSYSEAFLHAYAHEIRIVARFGPAQRRIENALCHEAASAGYMEPVPARIRDRLAAIDLPADICFLVFDSPTRTLDISQYTIDDAASAARAFAYDARAGAHRQRAETPGTIALYAPTQLLTPLHEFMHAISETANGRCDDLYVDPLTGAFELNKKARARAADPVPASFAALDGIAYASDPARDGLGYDAGWVSYHPELVEVRNPNVMDNYFRAADARRCRLDKLTLRFMRDRVEWKLAR
jgi:hypothetical protein